MIIVTGTILARPETLDEALGMSTEHVLRSRAEPGCISHAVFQDSEEPLRLQFVERWADMAALHAHFAVPESGAFLRAVTALAAERPTMRIYQAGEVTP
jgi:quinol monooxygenase YgiN